MKKLFLFLFLGLFLISLAQAQTYKFNEDLDIKVFCLNDGYCSNSSFCNINILDPNNDAIVKGQNMTNQISFHNYTITPNKTGEYQVRGFCKDGALSEEIDYTLLVTGDGTVTGISEALVNIALLLFFVGLFIGFYYIVHKVDFEKWYNSIIEKYKAKNTIKLIFSGLTFNIIKNSFVIYYLIGFPIMMVVTNLAFIYNVSALFDLMKVLMYLYGWSFVLVGLFFFSYVQEWIMDLLEELKEIAWGLNPK